MIKNLFKRNYSFKHKKTTKKFEEKSFLFKDKTYVLIKISQEVIEGKNQIFSLAARSIDNKYFLKIEFNEFKSRRNNFKIKQE